METDYKVVNGFIVSPGKFEGEPEWMPTLWDMVLGSMADKSVHDGTTAYDGFELDDDMAKLTGLEAKEGIYIVVWSDEQGFVSHMLLSESQLDDMEGISVDDDEPDLIDSDFDGITQEYYRIEINEFDDHPEYESGY